MDNIEVNRTTNRPNRQGNNNPMWGKKHSQESKNKMSQAAILRNRQYKKAFEQQNHITMDEFLSNNPTVEEYIKTLVKESIDRFIWNETKNIKSK